MSEPDVTQEQEQTENIAQIFAAIRQFEVILDNGTKRKAELRLPTPDEARRAKEYEISIIMEKSQGEPDPITGKIIKLPTTDNMMEYAKEKGLWTNEDDVEFTTLETQLKSKINQIVAGNMKLSRAYDLAMQIYQHRKDIFPYNRRKWDIYGLTANAAGEEASHKYMLVATAVWDNGERIFSDIGAFERGGDLRTQVMARYMTIIRMQNEYTTLLDTEIGFLRDYGFLDSKGNVYDVKKQEIVMNIYVEEETEDTDSVFGGFTDDDGNAVAPSVHPSLAPEDTEIPPPDDKALPDGEVVVQVGDAKV